MVLRPFVRVQMASTPYLIPFVYTFKFHMNNHNGGKLYTHKFKFRQNQNRTYQENTAFSFMLTFSTTLKRLQDCKNIYLPVTECAQEFVLVMFHSLQYAYKL